MKIVLDTNVMVTILGKKSEFRHVWLALLNGEFQLCLTTEILLEYEEMLFQKYGQDKTGLIMEVIMELPEAILFTRYYSWLLIHADPDDDKFVDCAIAARAKFLVSDDRHFRILAEIDFPKVEVITLDEFTAELFKNQSTS